MPQSQIQRYFVVHTYEATDCFDQTITQNCGRTDVNSVMRFWFREINAVVQLYVVMHARVGPRQNAFFACMYVSIPTKQFRFSVVFCGSTPEHIHTGDDDRDVLLP